MTNLTLGETRKLCDNPHCTHHIDIVAQYNYTEPPPYISSADRAIVWKFVSGHKSQCDNVSADPLCVRCQQTINWHMQSQSVMQLLIRIKKVITINCINYLNICKLG